MKILVTSLFCCLMAGHTSAQERLPDSTLVLDQSYHRLGISYDYTHFNKQFSQAWHMNSLEYMRKIKAGSYFARLNYGNRFGSSGIQVEGEAYPYISKTFYAYFNLGWSNNVPVFARWRMGASLFANLPKGFEADAGIRYLYFDKDTWLYTGSIGKYAGNWWGNLRTYLTPQEAQLSESFSVTIRRYLKSTDDYAFLSLASGISPDDRSQVVQLNADHKLRTQKTAAGYRFSFNKNIAFLQVSWSKVEYLTNIKDDQLNVAFGYLRKF